MSPRRPRSRAVALLAPATLLLVLTACGGGGDDGSPGESERDPDDAASSSAASPSAPEETDASEQGQPTESTEDAGAGPTLPEPPLCPGLDLRALTGGGESLELAVGDPYPFGGGAASEPTCYQDGPRGSVEITLYADAATGREVYDRVDADQGVPMTVCQDLPLTDDAGLPGSVAMVCEPDPNSPVPLPGSLQFVAPVEEGYLRCIAANPPGEREATARLQRTAAQVCGTALQQLTGL